MLTNEELSFIFQVVCLAVIGLYSIVCYDKIQNCVIVAIVVMVFANVCAQIIIAGGGPGACAGFFGLPLLGVIVSLVCAHAARYVRGAIKKK